MSYSFSKSGEIVISGWEAGISPSPYTGNGVQGEVLGLADMKGVNISSIKGEASVAYNRVRVDQPSSSGSFTVNSATPTEFAYSGTLTIGTWIKVTASTVSNVTVGNYYFTEPIVQGTSFYLYSDYGVTQITASESGTISFDTLSMGVPVSYTVENSGGTSENGSRYYILDNNSVIWVSGTANGAGASPSPLSSEMTWSAITPHGSTVGVHGSDTSIYGASICTIYSTNSDNVISGSFIVYLGDTRMCVFKNTSGWPAITGSDAPSFQVFNYGNYPHYGYYAYDQTLYFTDGPSIGILKEKPLQTYSTTAAIASGATSAQLQNAWTQESGTYSVTFSDGDVRDVTFTGNSINISWSSGLTEACSSIITVEKQSFSPTDSTTYDYLNPNYLLPPEDYATCLSSIPSNAGSISIIAGGSMNNLYFFPTQAQQTQPGPELVLWIPESNTQNMILANNYVFIFAGSKGNIYLTNGSSVIAVLTIPDYTAGALNFSQDPYFIWGGVQYIRGRIYFSLKDQNENHTGNCGGIWSFVPTFSYFFNQDVGVALRMESASSLFSTAGFQGYAPLILIGNELDAQDANGAQYLAAWTQGDNDGTNVVNSLDFSGTEPLTNGSSIIETDAIPVGTIYENKTFRQIECKFSAPLVSGESVVVKYRTNLNDSFQSAGTMIQNENDGLSWITDKLTFEKVQILQLQIILTSTTSNPSWCRLKEIYIR